MHGSLAAWLTQRPWVAAWLAALLGVLSLQGAIMVAPVASAVVALVWLERGALVGMNVGLAACAAIIGVLSYFQQPLYVALISAGILFGIPMLLAALLRRFNSLDLAYQTTVLSALVFLAGVFMVLPEPNLFWEQTLSQAFQVLQGSGLQLDAQLVPQLARTMWGALLAMWLLSSMSALCLARWWQALIHQPGAFGQEFRQLRSGNVLGTVLAMIAAAALVANMPWLDSMAWVAMTALALLGLAAAHRRKAEGQMQRGWLVAIYVLLIVPLFSFITVALLAGWGLADFWRRAAARPG